MGFEKVADLLASYKNKPIVPGICTDNFCDWIMNVDCDETADLCPHCETYTMQSILLLSGIN